MAEPVQKKSRIIDSRHPNVLSDFQDWEKWRLTYEGGDRFVERYVRKFTQRENVQDFRDRKTITPVPAFAKAAINDIRNSIFQRMADIIRRDGSAKYQKAVAGEGVGVDLRGSNMNSFMGQQILTELLIMGRVGIYVDMPRLSGPSLADVGDARPYLYMYQIEDILSWKCGKSEDRSEYQSVLLRDTCLDYDQDTLLPLQTFHRFRLLWIDQVTGGVKMMFMNDEGDPVDIENKPLIIEQPISLDIERIPFVMPNVGTSLLTDVCTHQIALVNLASSDVSYALKANFPFYTEQTDARSGGVSHLKPAANEDGTATAGGQRSQDRDIVVGPSQGRSYPIGANAPAFIHPSPEPLIASMQLQEKLERDIRKIVNLAVVNVANRASAASKEIDNQGLEAGLSYIGLVLESAERKIASYWAAYENINPFQRNVATIKYPDRYSLKTDVDRVKEAKELAELMFSVPGHEIKKEIAKNIVSVLLSGKVPVDKLSKIHSEIDKSKYLTSHPETILKSLEQGVVDEKTASEALGFDPTIVEQARKDHAERLKRIQEAQTPKGENMAARGVPDADPNPNSGKEERDEANDPDTQASGTSPTRGEGRERKE
jgi:hypothetical protein